MKWSFGSRFPSMKDGIPVNGVSSSSSSRSVTNTVSGSHNVIQGFSLDMGMGIGRLIDRENFTVGGYQWAIYFFPDGKNAVDIDILRAMEEEIRFLSPGSRNASRLHSLMGFWLQDRWASAQRFGVMGFGSKNRDRVRMTFLKIGGLRIQELGLWFRLTFKDAGSSIAEEIANLMAETVTVDILLRGDPYCVLRDLCGGDSVFRGGGLCYRQYI